MPDQNSPSPFRPFFIAGPTGSGKSAVALELAERCEGEIVNADAFQLYAGIPIITAAPSPEDMALAPHHLYGILSPAEICGAGRFLELIQPVLAEIAGRGRIPIVTGGSGLYLKALTHGLQDAPASCPEVRAELEALGIEALRQRLEQLDPASTATIDPRNRRYVQRAVEICLTTGRPASELRQAWRAGPDPSLRGVRVCRDREVLYERINRRVETMFHAGAVEEVAAVPAWSSTSRKAIGVTEILGWLRGEGDRDSCIRAIQQASRRYAKRQGTWFRKETWLTDFLPGISTVDDLLAAQDLPKG